MRLDNPAFQHIARFISDIVYSCVADPGGNYRIDWITGPVEEIAGYAQQEIQAMGCWGVLVIEPDQSLFDEYVAGLAVGASASCELRLRRKDGGVAWVGSRAECMPDDAPSGGAPSGGAPPGRRRLYGALADITERKQMQQALEAEEAKYRAIFEHMAAACCLHELIYENGRAVDCRVLEVNPAFETITGLPRSRVVGARMSALFGPGQLLSLDVLSRVAETGQPAAFDAFFKPIGKFLHVTAGCPGPGLVSVVFSDITARIRAEEALATERALLRTLVDHLPDAIYVKDAACRKTLSNPVDVRHAGAACEAEVLGRTDLDLYPPDLAAAFYADDQHVIQTGQPILNREEMISLPDGSRGWQLTSKVPLRDGSGRVTGLVGVGRDITDRRQVEAQLSRSERQLNKAQRIANVGSWVWHIPTNRLEWSDQMYRIFGIDQAGFTGDLADVIGRAIHPDDRAAVEQSNQRVVDEKKPVPMEYRVVWPDGTIRVVWAEAGELILDEAGAPVLLTGIVQDITERKRIESALRESERRYKDLLDMAPVGIAVHSQGRIVFTNPAGVRLLGGESQAQLVGKPIAEVIHPDHWQAARQRIDRMMAGEQGLYPTEDVYRKLDGTPIDVEVMATMLTYDGEPAVQVVVMDITARKQAQEEIRSLNAELEQRVRDRTAELEAANKELEAFAYSVSHDLRAPLRALDGFGAMLQQDQADRLDEAGRHYLARIREASQRMGQMINDLLDLSRVTRREMERQPVDLGALAQRIAADLRDRQPERPVEFVVVPQLVVQGDAGLLRILMENLLDNAWKYTATRRPARIEVGVSDQAGRPVVFVRDNGVGFDMAYAGKLFTPFQRLHRAAEFPGTGIGLATAYRVVARHGGRLWVEASVDRGATFYFTLG